jgi:hypothetical protein
MQSKSSQSKLAPATQFCPCIPTWFDDIRKYAEKDQCSVCKKEFTGTGRTNVSLLIPCAQMAKRVHTYGVLFHKKCRPNFDKEQKELGHNKYYDLIEMHPQDIPIQDQKPILWKCLKNHERTGKICPPCETLEETHTKFKACTGCYKVSYCSRECQKKHWKGETGHKKHCKRKKKPVTTTTTTSPLYNPTKVCKCFNEKERMLQTRQVPSMCSNPKCDERVSVDKQCDITHKVVDCRLGHSKQKEMTHFIPQTFCSKKCKKVF